MQIRIIAVGKVKERFLQEGIYEYLKRLRPYADVQVLEVADEKRPAAASPATESVALVKEGERILAAIPKNSHVIVLDVNGVGRTSPELAALFGEWELAAKNQLAFVIGGDLGLSPAVLSRADLRLSLSKMTFTHPMARFVLLEQVYRAFRILRGEPYHK